MLLTVIALAIGSGLFGAALLGGLITGAIDGPGRGGVDTVAFAEHPVTFCFMALMYLICSAGLAIYAYRIAKGVSALE
jgi:hypothetical protein